MQERDNELKKIKDEVIECQRCQLHKTRNLPVIGQGSHSAKTMFIGEAPGQSEDQTGRPFCGAAGKVLDELLASVNIKREEVYICNILKCRPPGNRNPKPDEIKACTSYLLGQIEIIKPEIICTLGNFSTAFILEQFGLKDKVEGIGKIHGKVFEAQSLFGKIKIIPLYHPAAATYNPNMKTILQKDFQSLLYD